MSAFTPAQAARFDRYVQAALTGLLANPALVDNLHRDVLEDAMLIARMAVETMPIEPGPSELGMIRNELSDIVSILNHR